MRIELVVVGLNHRTVPVDVRERYAVAGDMVPDLCRRLVAQEGISEAVVVSTCNRVEVYVVPKGDASGAEAAKQALAQLGAPAPGIYTYVGDDAVRHLFRVSASLDSLVVGEPQILGQVKEAYHTSLEAGTVGPVLKGCFGRAFKAAKRVRTDTSIARAAVSVGHVAVELAKTIFGDMGDVNVLLVGAGKMGVMASRHLSDNGAKKVLVANRTFERGKALADQHGWAASAYADLPYLLQSMDVVICSTGSPVPVLTRDMVAQAVRKRRYRPLFLIDIAVPRDIDPACGEVDGVYLYNVDDLEEVSRVNAEGRQGAVLDAESIVAQELDAFDRWRKERHAAPLIKVLREMALETAAREAQKAIRLMPGLDEKGVATVEKLAEIVATRLMQGPIVSLKARRRGSRGEELASVLEEIFDLERHSDDDA